MRAFSKVVTEQRNGGTVLAELRSEPPLAVRPTRRGIALVGSAAAPVGGDELELEVIVGDGCSLYVEAVAATMLFPGRGSSDASSHQRLRIRVGANAHLTWCAQPLLSVMGSHHVQRVTIDLAPSASLDFHDWVALGRTDEPPGVLDTELRITRGARALVHQHQVFDPSDPATATTAGIGDVDQIEQRVVVGGAVRTPEVRLTPEVAEMRAGPATDVEYSITLHRRRQKGA